MNNEEIYNKILTTIYYNLGNIRKKLKDLGKKEINLFFYKQCSS